MKVLVVGQGGREHVLCWKIALSPHVDTLFCAPGNAGTAQTANNVSIAPLDFTRLIWASLFGLFIFSEWPDVWTFVGAGIIVISGTFMLYREDRI